MSLRTYLLGIFISTILCWVAFILIVTNTNPVDSGRIAIFSFFGSLFFGLIGLFTLIGYYLRVWFSKNETIYANIGVAFRQAILFSLCFIILLVLQSIRLLTWWNGLLLVLVIISLEFYFLAKKE